MMWDVYYFNEKKGRWIQNSSLYTLDQLALANSGYIVRKEDVDNFRYAEMKKMIAGLETIKKYTKTHYQDYTYSDFSIWARTAIDTYIEEHLPELFKNERNFRGVEEG